MTEGLAQAAGPSVPHSLDVDPAPDQPDVGSRQERRKRRVRQLGLPDVALVPLVFIVGCVVTWLRGPWVFTHPQLWAEDGAVFFQSAYNQGWHAPLIQAQAGYLQTFPRLVSDLGLLVPIDQVPLLFAAVALAVQVLPAVIVSSRRFATAVPDYRVRLLLAAAYLLIPNSREINVDLTNAQWHLAVLAVLVVLACPPRGLWYAFDVGAVVLSGLTGPFVLSLVVVVAIVYYRRRQRWTLALGALVAAGTAVQLIELTTAVRPRVGPLGITGVRFVEVLGGRLIGNTFLGSSTTTSTAYYDHLLLFSSLMLAVGLVVVAGAMWRGPFELRMFNLWAGLVLAGSLASPLAAVHGSQWQTLISDAGGRYWYIPSLALVADVIWLAGQLRGGARRWAAAGAVVLLVAMAGFGVREDFRFAAFPAPSWHAQATRFDRLPPGQRFTFKTRPLGWRMTLYKK